MQEILYRGKDIDQKEWRYGSYVAISEPDGYVLHYICELDGQQWIVFPETVSQYIGIEDIHQKKIFNGDIIRFVWDSDSCWGKAGTYTGYIRFNEGIFEVVYIDREKITTDTDGYWHENSESDDVKSFFWWSEEVEVIGNIYDNPEMKVIE